MSISASAKNEETKRGRGRPPSTGTGQTVGVRVLPDVMQALDQFCAGEDPSLSRADGLRRLAVEALKARKLIP